MTTSRKNKDLTPPISGSEKFYMENLEKIMQSVADRRKELRLTQKEVAIKAGLEQPSVSRLESTKVIPNIETLLKVFYALDMEITIKS